MKSQFKYHISRFFPACAAEVCTFNQVNVIEKIVDI